MGLLDHLFPRLADRHRRRAEERRWQESGRYPDRIVRVYRSERQMRRDARRLGRMGYTILFQSPGRRTTEWRSHVTYVRRS